MREELKVTDRYANNWLGRVLEEAKDKEGDELIGDIMKGPITLVKNVRGQKPRFIEPMKIAVLVMDCRAIVAEHFRDALESVKKDHANLIRTLLEERLADEISPMILEEQRKRVEESIEVVEEHESEEQPTKEESDV